MRIFALFACIFACLWGQAGYAKICVWIDNEAEKTKELPQAQAKIHGKAVCLEEAEQWQFIEVEPSSENELQPAENSFDSDSYANYPKDFSVWHYRFPKYRSRGGIYYHKPHKFRKGHRRFKRPHFSTSHYFRNRIKIMKFHHGGTYKDNNSRRHHTSKYGFKSGGFSRFKHHTGGQTRFRGHSRASFGRR